jgi:hypothetical protein
MGALTQLREELEGLAGELDDVALGPDVARQPEVARARAVVDEARTALASAYLSRRALVLAREAIERAQSAVEEALEVSRVLRDRSAMLKTSAEEIRSLSSEARGTAEVLATWSERLRRQAGHLEEATGVVIDSAIPADHPEKTEIEAAISAAFTVVGGRWQVWVTVPSGAGWWGLRVHGPGVDWVGTLQDADEQTAEGVAYRLEPIVRVAVAEAVYRRERRVPRAARTPNN